MNTSNLEKTKNYNILVKGKVQGVYFRKFTFEQAIKLGITGFVKNLVNGDVMIEAEGSKEQLEGLIRWCVNGPSNAIVSELITKEGELKNYTSFTIEK